MAYDFQKFYGEKAMVKPHDLSNESKIMHDNPEAYKDPGTFKEARKSCKLSQLEWSHVLGLDNDDSRSVRRYETGERPISGPLARLVWFLMKHGIPKIFKQDKD